MNNKGVVLVMVLWVLLILSLVVWGLGRRSAQEVSLVETYRGKLRSYAAARAGINDILDLLDRSPSTKDTLYASGITIEQTKSPEDIFGHIDAGRNAFALVQWPARNFSSMDAHLEFGLQDEEGRININAIGLTNFQILSALLQINGLSPGDGDKLALAIINYTGLNAQPSNNNAFKDLNDTLLKPKNKPYENIFELLEVNGMTLKIFDKIKDDLTVYGDTQRGLWINLDTASNNVIQAVANAAARLNPSVNAADVMRQAYSIRDGADGQSFSADDGVGSLTGNMDPNWPVALQEGRSNYYRARVVGVDNDSGTRSVLDVVIHDSPGAQAEIVSWKRD